MPVLFAWNTSLLGLFAVCVKISYNKGWITCVLIRAYNSICFRHLNVDCLMHNSWWIKRRPLCFSVKSGWLGFSFPYYSVVPAMLHFYWSFVVLLIRQGCYSHLDFFITFCHNYEEKNYARLYLLRIYGRAYLCIIQISF